MQKRNAVLIFLRNDNELLLAESNYRPGRITWNGISGFIENKDKPKQAAVKELYKAIKVRVYEHDLEQVGIIHLYTVNDDSIKKETLTITIFVCERWQDEPKMTPGVRPRWFTIDTIPYADMFEDTKEWLKKVLGGEQVVVEVLSKIDSHTGQTTVTDVIVRDIYE